MYIILFIIFSFWLLITCVYIIKPNLLGKLKLPLHRFGFFGNWTMYVPNSGKVSKTFNLLYRDKSKNGDLKDWQEFDYPEWNPLLFIYNPMGRLNSVFTKCVSVLLRLNQQGQGSAELKLNPYFLYICEIVCSYHSVKDSVGRQVRLQYNTSESDSLLVCESDFNLLR